MGITVLIAGVFTALNLIVIMLKIKRGRTLDAIVDGGLLVLLTFVFGGSITGLLTAVVASSIISMYLLAVPPKMGEI